jgi:[ribosomal protein S5]-alanine N-acetyltransferase
VPIRQDHWQARLFAICTLPSFKGLRRGADGIPLTAISAVPEAIVATYAANADLYRRVGFVPPWVSYVAVDDDRAVGGGAFVGPPRDNRVEIAYFTVKELEGRRYATRTAAELIAIARNAEPGIMIAGFTLRERMLLLGFCNAQDPDAGDVWEWRT